MRQLGYRTAARLADGPTRGAPPPRRATPAEMRERLHGPPPEQPEPFEQILDGLERDVLPFASRDGHPGFFGFVPFAGTWPGARRPDRERLQPLRRLVDGVGRPEPGRARGARL